MCGISGIITISVKPVHVPQEMKGEQLPSGCWSFCFVAVEVNSSSQQLSTLQQG